MINSKINKYLNFAHSVSKLENTVGALNERSLSTPLMGKLMSEHVQYITNDRGDRVGVLLEMEVYQRLANQSNLDAECLGGLNIDELQALAQSQLAIVSQSRLTELLARNAESQLSTDEVAELDYLVAQIDQLTILKTRARYTQNYG
jgi:molybdenum cofactor biosynthesis enzyme MoaA